MAELRDIDDVQKAHDCLTAFVAGEHPLTEGIPEEVRRELQSVKLARSALESLCWVLKHDRSLTAFQRNLDGLGWQDMEKVHAEE